MNTSAERDVFLSYNTADRAPVERIASELKKRDLTVFLDRWELVPGQPWPGALEMHLDQCRSAVVVLGPLGMGTWQQRELYLLLDRQVKDHSFSVIPVILPNADPALGFLSLYTWVDLRGEVDYTESMDLLAAAVRGNPPPALVKRTQRAKSNVCPYRGLEVFREEDAGFYFGREPDVNRLAEAVDEHPLVAIVGSSGSGKSSLVRAGLIPHLRRQADERVRVWQVADLVPGSNPFLALARALLPLREPERVLTWSKGEIDDECKRLQAWLEKDGAEHLIHVVEQILAEEPGTTHLLLLVDQWEELYTYRPIDADHAKAHRERVGRFILMLLEGVREGALHIVITLRADYWGEVLNDVPLAARLLQDDGKPVVHLGALDRAALETVIRRPAEITRLSVPDALVKALLDAAAGQPGDLPLLEFTLRQLWAERAGGSMTLDAYRDMGGLEKAIITRADTVYASLNPEGHEAVPGVFAALVQVGEARTDLRRRARLAELGEAGQAVAHRLADERLLVTSRDWSSGEELVEVAHEALLHHWPKLEAWIDARRGALLTLRQLQADTRSWLEKHRCPSYLWSHERVREAAIARKQLGSEVVLSKAEREFLGPIDPDVMLEELKQGETDHKRRALIGERLDALGDTRDGVGVAADGTPDITWCTVSGGHTSIEVECRLLRGTTEREFLGPIDPDAMLKKLEHGVDVDADGTPDITWCAESKGHTSIEVAWRCLRGTKLRRKQLGDFRIARYPVTVSQYRAFLEAKDGWCEEEWWQEGREGHLYLDKQGCLVRDPEGKSYDFGRFGNHPAVYVSWFDALAFCRWLNNHSKATVRLPDEWEWQRAATVGDPANVFPWGGEWEPKLEPFRANTFESRLGAPTAVGMYPDGATPKEVSDMAGTVWEWCLNRPIGSYIPDTNRVLRGGSWYPHGVLPRIANRRWFYPTLRFNYVGFRVLCASDNLVEK